MTDPEAEAGKAARPGNRRSAARPWRAEVHDAAEGVMRFILTAESEEAAIENAGILAAENGCRLVGETIVEDIIAGRIRDEVLARRPEALAAMRVDTVNHLIGERYPEEVILASLAVLAAESPACLREVWLIDSEEGGLEIDAETLAYWRDTGELIDPVSGCPVPDPESHVWREWAAVAPETPGLRAGF